MNPARRLQDALLQRRGGVKEDYYVQEIDLSNFFCFGSGLGRLRARR